MSSYSTAGHVTDAAMTRCGHLLKPTKGKHFFEGPYVEYEDHVAVDERDEFIKRLQKSFSDLVSEGITTRIETLTNEEADRKCNGTSSDDPVFDLTLS